MKRTDQTLLEQMKITDIDIQRRKELLQLTEKDLSTLPTCKIIISEQLEHIVSQFYESQTSIDEISLLIGDADTLKRLMSAQRQYIIDLFNGFYDSEYVNNRLRIGMVHKRIGVKPALYLSAVQTLKELIFKTLKEHLNSEPTLNIVTSTLEKLLQFDITLVFDTYIDSLVSEIETAKKRTELYAKGLEEKVAERTEELEHQALVDPLTTLYNQRALHDMLRRELLLSRRNKQPLSFVYFDLDNFKTVNDKLGHQKGDVMLKLVAHILHNTLREVDIPCRYGGDEFCVILPGCSGENAVNVCKKITELASSLDSHLSFSIGISVSDTENPHESDPLIEIADKKMYKAKQHRGHYIEY